MKWFLIVLVSIYTWCFYLQVYFIKYSGILMCLTDVHINYHFRKIIFRNICLSITVVIHIALKHQRACNRTTATTMYTHTICRSPAVIFVTKLYYTPLVIYVALVAKMPLYSCITQLQLCCNRCHNVAILQVTVMFLWMI